MASIRYTAEQVADLIAALDDESELADIDSRDVEATMGMQQSQTT